MSIEQQAEQLAEWLEANPGTPPPADIDPEVIEAVYSLRPELAPPARVDLDEILGSVEEGPFQQRTEEIPIPPVATADTLAEVIQLSSMRQQSRRAVANSVDPSFDSERRAPQRPHPSQQRLNVSPRFLLGSIGGVALLAAACALFILVPALQSGERAQTQPQPLEFAKNVVERKAPQAAIIDGDIGSVAEAPVDTVLETPPVAAPKAATNVTAAVTSPPQKTAPNLASRGEAFGEAQDTPTSASKPRLQEPGRVVASGSVDTIKAKDDGRVDELSFQTRASAQTESVAMATRSAKKERSRRVERSVMSDDVAEVEETETFVGQWKTPVAPYPKDWSAPPLNTREQQVKTDATALEAASDWLGAAQVFQQAIPKSKSQVGQYFAAEATIYLLEASDTAKAVKAANRCVALSAQNTAQLSRCYCVLGDAYQAAGDAKKANAAYEKADRLNRKR